MNFIRFFLSATLFCMCVSGRSHPESKKDVVFQLSTIGALAEGCYEGAMTCEQLKKKGDFGIGTFDALDGEMVVLDGEIHRVQADGKAYSVGGGAKTPFAVVTFFEPDNVASLDRPLDYERLRAYVASMLPTRNIFHAIKIHGAFRYVKTRSVPRQDRPYPRLSEVVKKQPTFELRDVKGTMIGFWVPAYMDGVNVPGYHFHFLTSDRKAGGHVLECQVSSAKVEVDYSSEFHMLLPSNADFYSLSLEKPKPAEIDAVENSAQDSARFAQAFEQAHASLERWHVIRDEHLTEAIASLDHEGEAIAPYLIQLCRTERYRPRGWPFWALTCGTLARVGGEKGREALQDLSSDKKASIHARDWAKKALEGKLSIGD